MNPLWLVFTRAGGSSLGRDWMRPPPTRAQQRNDIVAMLILLPMFFVRLILTMSAGVWGDSEGAAADAMVWSTIIAVFFAFRRRFPLSVLVFATATTCVATLFDPFVASTFPLDFFFYASICTAAAWGRTRRQTNLILGVAIGSEVWSLWYRLTSPEVIRSVATTAGEVDPSRMSAYAIYLVGITAAYTAAVWVVGTLSWRAARQREELREQTAELATEQSKNSREAVVADRVRIARDLHDVVAHHVSVIGVQASAARRSMDSDERSAADSLLEVESSSRRAVNEMRALLGALRADEPTAGARDEPFSSDDLFDDDLSTLSPLPGIADLHRLISRAGSLGLDVQFRIVGEPIEVPRSVGLSMYRTAQEALSNVQRHSTATSVYVVLRYLDEHDVEIDIQDLGSPSGVAGGTGLGQRGMRERAALHGGDVEIGPMPSGGFRVRMRLPIVNRSPALHLEDRPL
ncbi:MAG: hypothetical protein RI885_743 [Actinomycetota bacterium]